MGHDPIAQTLLLWDCGTADLLFVVERTEQNRAAYLRPAKSKRGEREEKREERRRRRKRRRIQGKMGPS